jgi:hypothetical protein
MPYVICAPCQLTTYSAALYSSTRACPRCGGLIDRGSAARESPPARRMLDQCRLWSASLRANSARPGGRCVEG